MGANVSFPERAAAPSSGSMPSSGGSGQRTPTVPRHHAFLTNEDAVTREKKKKSSKLATLRKKLIRARRHSRSFDHSKAIRELTSSWSIRELNALVEEYEASVALKELHILADLARPHAASIKEDLSALYDFKYCTDIDLVYKGSCFPAHRAILAARSPYFRSLLTRHPTYTVQIPVHIRTPGVDVHLFSALLRYLYSGEVVASDGRFTNYDLLVALGEEFGVPNLLEHDLRHLLETGDYSDAVLVFSSDCDAQDSLTPDGLGGTGTCGAEARTCRGSELRCHKAILAARSPFFRNLLLRRQQSGEELTDHALYNHTRIVLDESVIPKQYARVLLNAIYMDNVDLSYIVRSSTSMCSLSEVQAMVAGKGHMTQIDEAMEIYQIGQFLDFQVMSQGCEDVIVEQLTIENLVGVLTWSAEPHGSTWCRRQALHFLSEEFLQLAHSQVLFDLTKADLIRALRSDFTQAGELDVLTAVLKWAENQLIKQIEEREPNLLSHTAHSVSKKGIKKRDLSDLELRDILADLLPHVRVDHVIPHNHDVLTGAIKRGLVSTPPSHMIGDEGATSRVSAWIRGKNNGVFIKPRLFVPYYEETKALLEEQISQVQENEVVRLRMVHMSPIPDTLYMVEERGVTPMFHHHHHHHCMDVSNMTATIDQSGTILVPDMNTMKALKQREASLQHTPLFQRAFSLPRADRRGITMQVALRVVREFGLPDTTVDVLLGMNVGGLCRQDSDDSNVVATTEVMVPHYRTPQRRRTTRFHHAHTHHSPSLPVSPTRSYSPVEKEASTCSDSVLSDMMPDIAMATASMTQMQLHDLDIATHGDLELDLGDGNNHSGGTGTLYI